MIDLICRTALMGSTVGLGVLGAIDPLGGGAELARLGVSGVLGVVAVASVMGLQKIYRDKQMENQKHDDKLYELIEESARAISATAEKLTQQTGILVEVKDAIVKCKAKE